MIQKPSDQDLRREIVGNFLKSAREKVGLTQSDIATRLGFSTPQFVSNWERGISLPSLDTMRRLSQMLRIPPRTMIDMLYQYQEKMLEVRKHEILSYFKAR